MIRGGEAPGPALEDGSLKQTSAMSTDLDTFVYLEVIRRSIVVYTKKGIESFKFLVVAHII